MLILKRDFFTQIVQHCKRELPDEACGILAGKNNTAEKVYTMANAQKSPENYLMDPKEQLRVMKEMRSCGLEMLAIYHSHTVSQAYPSKRDIEMAFYPDTSYVILSLQDKDNPRIRSFKIAEGKVTEEEIKITEA